MTTNFLVVLLLYVFNVVNMKHKYIDDMLIMFDRISFSIALSNRVVIVLAVAKLYMQLQIA